MMEKQNIDWANIGFGYMPIGERFVANYKDGKWDNGSMTADTTITISECAGVLQYAQTCFEGMKAYTTCDGRIVVFRPDLNGQRMEDSCKRLEIPVLYGVTNGGIPPREPFIFISVSGNNLLIRSIPSLVIFPYKLNDPIFIFDISSGILIVSINWISNLFISLSSNSTAGNSFTLILMPLPQPSF